MQDCEGNDRKRQGSGHPREDRQHGSKHRDQRFFTTHRAPTADSAECERQHGQPRRQIAAAQHEQCERRSTEDERAQDIAQAQTGPSAARSRVPCGGALDQHARLAGGASDVPFKRTADTEPVAATPDVEARRGVHACHRGEVDRVAPWTFQFEHAVAGLDSRAIGGLPGATRSTVAVAPTWVSRSGGRAGSGVSGGGSPERSTPSPAGHRNGATASTWMPAQTSAAATTLATTHDVCG